MYVGGKKGRGFVIQDGVAGNTHEDWVLANLRYMLQLLAASGLDQLDHYLPPLHGVITNEMAEDFDNFARSVPTYWTLSPLQTQALNAILAYFDAHDYAEHPTFWEDDALVSDERWEQMPPTGARCIGGIWLASRSAAQAAVPMG